MIKFDEMMDNYCAFMDYGVRGWLTFAGTAFLAFFVDIIGMLLQIDTTVVSATLMGVGFLTMIWLWSRDYALGHVPRFWLDLGRAVK